jgi:Cu-Zn family superoxide dismutase
MKRIQILACFAFLVTLLIVLFSTKTIASDGAMRARAIIRGAPESGIAGRIEFWQTTPGFISTVSITGYVSGLDPNTLHGFHIHENGTCSPNFAAAGGHFDAGPFSNSTPVDDNHPFHSGDLPNIKANNDGVAVLKRISSRITLSQGPLSVFDENGSSVIVHANEDLGTTDVVGSSGGPRIACGVIERIDR